MPGTASRSETMCAVNFAMPNRPRDWPGHLEWDEELFQERAGIREYEGNTRRPAAERLAREDVRKVAEFKLALLQTGKPRATI